MLYLLVIMGILELKEEFLKLLEVDK